MTAEIHTYNTRKEIKIKSKETSEKKTVGKDGRKRRIGMGLGYGVKEWKEKNNKINIEK